MPDSNQPSDYTFSGTTGTDLSEVTMSEVYRDLITINTSTNNNQGLTNSLKYLRDGGGTTLPLQVSDNAVNILGDLSVNDLYIGNTINLNDGSNQYLFNVGSGVTGTVFKIRVGDSDVFKIDEQGRITSPSIGADQTSANVLTLTQTAEEDVTSPTVGSLRWDGTNLLLYS